ncbi:hypothetical protein [Sphaerochaeta sp.]|jgi:hypothetical protein|uniref:hypothetical protein n=1 Tax=Sphaerochaeta sp. TaxID=1972642 RepID=UPI00259047AC|nr:hypothetical protein [Sphaerochaeta sp.]MDD3457728.1 hypothetical protein [Sphaerochaeta sp.]
MPFTVGNPADSKQLAPYHYMKNSSFRVARYNPKSLQRLRDVSGNSNLIKENKVGALKILS